MFDKPPTIILTGASGFIGRHLLEELKNHARIFAIARRSQSACNAPVHPNIAWLRADITDASSMTRAFREIATAGGAEYFLHLAAYYEFSGERHPQYTRTNVDGTRLVLDFARTLSLKRFIFSSSVAACAFPPPGAVLTETSPPDGGHIYAWSKREGESMVRANANLFPTAIVRFGALFSDWCEYAPLYVFLNTWLGRSARARILAGRGESAILYIHVRDVVAFFRQLFAHEQRLPRDSVLIASTGGSTSHKTLFQVATWHFRGAPLSPVFLPRSVCGIGLLGMYAFGKLVGRMPFERPWMHRYIDKALNVDHSATSALIGWSPESRYRIERRMPFLIERLKSEPQAWHSRNLVAMRRDPARPEYELYAALAWSEDRIIDEVMAMLRANGITRSAGASRLEDESELTWFVRMLYRLLLSSLQISNRLLLLNYFEMSSFSQFEAGMTGDDLIALLRVLRDIVLKHLEQNGGPSLVERDIHDGIRMPFDFAFDEIEHQYQVFREHGSAASVSMPLSSVDRSDARSQLEETIWACLVKRR